MRVNERKIFELGMTYRHTAALIEIAKLHRDPQMLSHVFIKLFNQAKTSFPHFKTDKCTQKLYFYIVQAKNQVFIKRDLMA